MSDYRLLINTDVATMDPDHPQADSLLICGDRIAGAGSAEELRGLAPEGVLEMDLGGRCIIPGLIETHNHLSYYSLTLFMVDCSPFANQDMAEVLERISARAGETGADEWVIGWGYDDTLGQGARHLNRTDLDRAAPRNPVLIMHASGHLSYANSQALNLAGISRDTPQPAGGEIDKDEAGDPTGLLLEPGAQMLVLGVLPKPDHAVLKESIPLAAAIFNRCGITGVHDGAVGMAGQGPQTYRAYRELEAEGGLSLRVYLTTMADYYDGLLEVGLGRGFGSDLLRIGAVKMFQDGSIQGLTAALTEDYHCRPGFKGEFIMPQEEMDAQVARFHREGLQIAIHANGDRAIDSVLTAFERAQEKHPQRVLRHMIIHCQTAREDQIDRMIALGVVPSYFPNHVWYWGDRHRELFLGPERAARISPLRSSIDKGLRFTLHADTPVTPISPLHSIHCAVNRITSGGEVLGPEQRISPIEALKAFTVDAAHAGYQEDRQGMLKAGYLADYVVLSENPARVDPLRIKEIKVLETVVGGRTVFKA